MDEFLPSEVDPNGEMYGRLYGLFEATHKYCKKVLKDGLEAYVKHFLELPENHRISTIAVAKQRATLCAVLEREFGKESFFQVYGYMKGLLDFEKSMKNARARNFLKNVWVVVVIKWLEVAEDLRKGKPWHELSSPFYAWLACNAVPYHDSSEATSGCKRFAKV